MGRDDAALFDGKTSSWVEMISTNVLGPCMCTREALQVGIWRGGTGVDRMLMGGWSHSQQDSPSHSSMGRNLSGFCPFGVRYHTSQWSAGSRMDAKPTSPPPPPILLAIKQCMIDCQQGVYFLSLKCSMVTHPHRKPSKCTTVGRHLAWAYQHRLDAAGWSVTSTMRFPFQVHERRAMGCTTELRGGKAGDPSHKD